MDRLTIRSRQQWDIDAKRACDEVRKSADRQGEITLAGVVEEASDPDNETNKCFEWDDTKAADLWRQQQARELLRSIYVNLTVDNMGEVRAFAETERGKYVYNIIDGNSLEEHNGLRD